jgi:hypothetical protein
MTGIDSYQIQMEEVQWPSEEILSVFLTTNIAYAF